MNWGGAMIPLELPVRAGEAAVLADMILQLADKKPLNDDVRQRIATRGAALKLESITPYYGSLQKDPSHQSAFFLAVDGITSNQPQPLLLRFAPASSPASALFPQSILIGRMRPGTREILVNAVPFSADDGSAIRSYVQHVDPSFLPRPQGAQMAIVAGTDLASAFTSFRTIHKKTGINVASVALSSATPANVARFYEETLWAAVRAGWREGYNLGAGFLIEGNSDQELAVSVEAARQTVVSAAGYTRFSLDTSPLVTAIPEADGLGVQFQESLGAEDSAWCLDEFAEYELAPVEIMQLAVKFHRSLTVSEQLYDHIRAVKSQSKTGRTFDFQISLSALETTPHDVLFCLHWLKSRGRAAQMVTLDNQRLSVLAPVARSFNVTPSVTAAPTAESLENVGRDTGGRWNLLFTGDDAGQIVSCFDRLRAG
jgi:hypothetical protein